MYLTALQTTHADVGELVALCDPNPARMEYYRRELGLTVAGERTWEASVALHRHAYALALAASQ